MRIPVLKVEGEGIAEVWEKSLIDAANAATSFDKTTNQKLAGTPNAEILLKSQKNKQLKEVLKKVDFNFPDSISVIWATKTLNKKWTKSRAFFELLVLPFKIKKYPNRVCGSDLFEKICETCH